jgi:hypothetical protein
VGYNVALQFGLDYQGVITDINDNVYPENEDPATPGPFNLLLEYLIYQYKNGVWTTSNNIGFSGSGNSAEVFNHPSNIASGASSHAEGVKTKASGTNSHAEGKLTEASGLSSHAEGFATVASNIASHAEGEDTKAEGYASHTEGGSTKATGNYSHAEGTNTEAIGERSHAGGHKSIAEGYASFAHGFWLHAKEPY